MLELTAVMYVYNVRTSLDKEAVQMKQTVFRRDRHRVVGKITCNKTFCPHAPGCVLICKAEAAITLPSVP